MSNTNLNYKWYETEVGHGIISKKYFHDGEKTFDDMAERISACFSPQISEGVKQALYNADFFPGGRSLCALGSKGKFKVTSSNCFILPSPEDNLTSILDTAKDMAIISSRGGGCGINLSNLRPRGSKVNNAAKTSTGAVSFMEIYNTIGGVISQNGRRGALLIGLNVKHPDIEEFIQVKQNDTEIQSANISILVDDAFMEAVEDKRMYDLEFRHKDDDGNVIDKTVKMVDAYKLFHTICDANKDWAEPGLVFHSVVKNWQLMSEDPEYNIDICNPCGEFFGPEYNSCNLGSINLYNLVKDPFTAKSRILNEDINYIVDLSIKALDEILDYGYDLQPLDKNRENIENYRSIGLGVFGLADMLIAMGKLYDSAEAIDLSSTIMRQIFIQALRTSNQLAIEKGMFKKCNPELLASAPILDFLKDIDPILLNSIREHGLRHSTLLSLAPTGLN